MIRPGLTAVLMLLCAATAALGQTEWVRLDAPAASPEPASGIWRVVPEGAVFRCEHLPGHSGSYALRLLYSPDLSLRPGTCFGTMTPAGRPGVYDARLMLDPAHFSKKEQTRTFTIEMNGQADRMTFKAYKDKIKINLNRWLPYFFRVSVSRESTRPADLDGAVRIDGRDGGAGNIVIL